MQGVLKTVSGPIVTVSDALARNAKSLIVNFAPVQAAGTPAPDNVLPISGWTGVTGYISPTLSAQDGTTYPVDWTDEAGTVYGGTLDVVRGVLTVDRAMVEYDGSSDESWTEYGVGKAHFCCVISTNGKERGFQKSICNEFENVNSAFGSANYGIYSDHSNLINTYFRMPNADVNTKSEFLAWIAQHPIQLVYELATPITYQLTPQTIAMLRGVNNVWSNANGNTELTYYAQ